MHSTLDDSFREQTEIFLFVLKSFANLSMFDIEIYFKTLETTHLKSLCLWLTGHKELSVVLLTSQVFLLKILWRNRHKSVNCHGLGLLFWYSVVFCLAPVFLLHSVLVTDYLLICLYDYVQYDYHLSVIWFVLYLNSRFCSVPCCCFFFCKVCFSCIHD